MLITNEPVASAAAFTLSHSSGKTSEKSLKITKMIENNKEPTYSIDCHDVVEVLEFSPYEWSSDLIAVATTARISIGSCRFEVSSECSSWPVPIVQLYSVLLLPLGHWSEVCHLTQFDFGGRGT